MSKIKILSVALSNQIAAGEVVERPASVVKELVENAIDAKSRRIFVSILEGGSRLIQVSDDGEGMSHEEASLAFQRHATSKIYEAPDLDAITTLGFRGEALPSIASVSKVSLVTRTSKESEGIEISIEGGSVQSVKKVGCPSGSTFEIKDLFYNVPARKKFLKSQQTEMGHINRTLFHLALAHPEIHFRLRHGARSIFDVPACDSFKARAFQLLGEKVISGAMERVESFQIQEGLSLHAIFSRPPLKRNFKKDQYLFVNLRPIKSALLTHAVYEAYKSYLMKGEEPFFILFLSVDPNGVDVNVHPAKREVRFQNRSQVHQVIRNAIRDTLSSAGIGLLQQEENHQLEDENGSPAFSPLPGETPSSASPGLGWPDASKPEGHFGIFKEERSHYRERSRNERDPSFLPSSLFKAKVLNATMETEIPLIRPLAQVYGTFLLAEINGDLAIVDQHTAHERVIYEELLSAWENTDVAQGDQLEIQALLIPQQIDLSLAQSAVLKENIDQFEAIGCRIEPFGETTFLVRELPVLISKMNIDSFLNEVTDDLIDLGVSGKIDQSIRTVLASMACHGAVRAHQSLSFPEITALLQKYYERKTPPTCPHGRPIVIRYSLLELEKLFRRK